MKATFVFLVVAGIVVFAFVFALNIHGIIPSPADYAAATATVLRANALATEDIAHARAYQTAVPTRVAEELAAQSASVQAANGWRIGGLAIFVLIGLAGLAIFVLIGLAGVVFIRSRANQIPRGADGQIPGVRQGNAVIDMQRAIGPAVAVQNPSIADRFWHIVRHEPLPEPKIITSDAHADADHLLSAAQSANAVSATAAMFQPGVSNADRHARVELTRTEGRRDPWGAMIVPPSVRIVANGDDAIEIIAKHIGDALPAPVKQIEAPATLDHAPVLEPQRAMDVPSENEAEE